MAENSIHAASGGLDALLASWAVSHQLPAARAAAIRAAARESFTHAELPTEWWFQFTKSWAGALDRAMEPGRVAGLQWL